MDGFADPRGHGDATALSRITIKLNSHEPRTRRHIRLRDCIMIMTIKLAWRNLFRNHRRTFIAGSAIGIGLAAMIFIDALIIGMEENMVRTATSSFLGQAQIHAEGYRTEREVESTINDGQAVFEALSRDPRVKACTPRVMSLAMVSSSANVRSCQLIGVRPDSERALSQIDDTIQEGAFFASDKSLDAVLGGALAEILEVELGDRLVVTASEAETGDLAQALFRVSGIYRFGSREMDTGMVFVRIKKARELLGIGDGIHEIALTFENATIAETPAHPFWDAYSGDGNEAVGWPVLVPELKAVFQYSQLSLVIMGGILFAVVALGIVNTLFMSIYERMFEFGVLRAIGTRPVRLWALIVCEAAALAVLSVVLGTILGGVVTGIIARTGIDYRGIEMVGVTLRDLIYPVLTLKQFVVYPFWVLVLTVLVAFYPAVHAARVPAAEALRKSL